MFDAVALLEDLPDERVYRGQVGTLVEELAPGVFDVEFADTGGRAYAMLALREEQLPRLLYEPVTMAGAGGAFRDGGTGFRMMVDRGRVR